MVEEAQPIIQVTTPNRLFEGHSGGVTAVAVFPDGRRMVTGSYDETLCIWDLRDGVVLKKIGCHNAVVGAIIVSGDGKSIASGDQKGGLTWYGDTGESLTQTIKKHSYAIRSVDFSPDGAVLVTGSWDKTTKLWCTKTWDVQGNPIKCGADVYCVRYSPSGELLAIATRNAIEIWNPSTRKCIAKFKAANNSATNTSLTWTPDGTRLLSAGSTLDPTIREWDTSTWQQVGDPWRGHTKEIHALAVNSTLVASASNDNHVRLWRFSDRRTIAIFMRSKTLLCVTFSIDGKYVLSGGNDKKISEWAVPEDALLQDYPQEQASWDSLSQNSSEEQTISNILPTNTTVRNAHNVGHLPTAEELLAQEIDYDGNDHNSYSNRSLLMAQKGDWDNALHDALKSIGIQPSLTGYVSQGIALCGIKQFQDAMKAFDLAFMFADDSKTTHLLLLAIALFNANQHEEAILRTQELAAACPGADTLACRVVEAYFHVQLGINVLDDACHNEAADYFTTAINSDAFSSGQEIHVIYEVFVVLFGWDLQSLWKTANQKRCHALLRARRLADAHEAYRYMIGMSDEATMASCHDWSIAFKQECSTLYAADGDAALAAMDYDGSIELYSMAIELNSVNDTIFASRCAAKLGKMLWKDALLDAQKVIELNPLSYLGHELKHAALHGAQRYDDAIAAFENMLSRLNDTPDPQMRKLRQQYVTLSEATSVIQNVIHAHLENTPHRLFNTSTGRLYNRGAQINAFKTSAEYKELLLSTMKQGFGMKCIEQAVATYFRCVMLSHRWEENEPLLHDVQHRDIYDLDPAGGIAKLQAFCKTACDAGYRWAWVDTCCIDQTNNVEVQHSVNSMFVWYRHAALTMIYLSDVPPSSKSGALAKSVWNERGWTVQEFLAPSIVLFYQKDWTLYLNDRSPNHKDSTAIMRELADATGIDPLALVAFRPGMRGAREKLQWVSRRVTTLQEDIAYSLFGIFGVNLPVIYGEKKQNAFGRLLQEVVAQSGDITALDWLGKSSEFNSCLPADITSYGTPSCALPSLSEDEMQASVSSLRDTISAELASRLYHTLSHLSAPRFAARRLHLPCIVFPVIEVRRRRSEDQQPHSTFAVKANELEDLLITTEDNLVQFSRARPALQSFLLVRPWDRSLLDLPDFANFPVLSDTESVGDWSPSPPPLRGLSVGSLGENGPVHSESHSRELRLMTRLKQPFSAFLLAQQWGGEYKRIASDQNIIARVQDMASIRDTMDIRILEIL